MSLVGFRFRPSVKELIDVLKVMAHGGADVDVSKLTETPGDISKKELYGEVDKEPWKILPNDNEWDLYDVSDTGRKKATYVVTRLPKMGGESNNKVARKAGKGTWMGQTQPIVFEKDGEEIACMKSLAYVYTGQRSEAEDMCYYYLHEYSLTKPYLQKIGAKFSDYVICRVIKDTSKNCRSGRNVNSNRRPVDDFASSSGYINPNVKPLGDTVLQEPPPPYNYSLEFTENLGLWVNGHTPETQQQHHQDYNGRGISLEDLIHQDYRNVNCLRMSRSEEEYRMGNYGSIVGAPQEECSCAPAIREVHSELGGRNPNYWIHDPPNPYI